MRLRTATLADLALLRHWSAQPHVLAATDDDWGWEEELARSPDWREQLIVELDGRPLGFLQVMDPAREDSHYWGECAENLRAVDIWIGEEQDLGRGLGTEMMKLVLERCFASPEVTAVLVDPLATHVRVHPFYERLGFRFVERRVFGDDECAVYRLERADWRK
jgi:aminoglycoside 6'-N-acetyltransferase